jgi:hypothetical protein
VSILALSLAFAPEVKADTCSAGTLADYAALGASGCTIGSFLFSNFTVSGNSSILVQPFLGPFVGSSGQIGFTYTLGTMPTTFQLNYTVTALNGTQFTGGFLTLAPGAIGYVGSGGWFVCLNSTCPPGGFMAFTTVGNPGDTSDSLQPPGIFAGFQPVVFLDSQTSGTISFYDPAQLQGAPVTLQQTLFVQTPEPGTLLLIGTGLAGLIYRRRRSRAKESPHGLTSTS